MGQGNNITILIKWKVFCSRKLIPALSSPNPQRREFSFKSWNPLVGIHYAKSDSNTKIDSWKINFLPFFRCFGLSTLTLVTLFASFLFGIGENLSNVLSTSLHSPVLRRTRRLNFSLFFFIDFAPFRLPAFRGAKKAGSQHKGREMLYDILDKTFQLFFLFSPASSWHSAYISSLLTFIISFIRKVFATRQLLLSLSFLDKELFFSPCRCLRFAN